MNQILTTHVSLLMRIRNLQDSVSWADFVRLYAPMIFQYGRRMGLQDADAADVTQDVLASVAESIGDFHYDRNLGRFRGWLKTIAYHALCGVQRRKKRNPAVAESEVFRQAAANATTDSDARFWDDQYTQRIFRLAARQVEAQVQPTSWEAFSATTLRGEDPDAVAERLGMSVGAVYVAKSRVYSRVREALREFDEQ